MSQTPASKAPAFSTSLPGYDLVGRCFRDQSGRDDWRDLVVRLHQASQPGGPLDGWVFHGASAEEAAEMSDAEGGMKTGRVLVRPSPGGQEWHDGTHWATAWVAAYYAEERYEIGEAKKGALGFVAVRKDDLMNLGLLVPDEQSIDCPIFTRLEMGEDAIQAHFAENTPTWEDCYRLLGSFVCLSDVPGAVMQPITSHADLDALIAGLAKPLSNLNY